MSKDPLKSSYLWILKLLARLEMRKHRKAKIIGITGSSGKSTAKELLIALLKPHYKERLKYTIRGNSETGIPYEILDIPVKTYPTWKYPLLLIKALHTVFISKRKFDVFIVEYGIDSPYSPRNMEYLLSIIKPDISLLLSVTPAHGANFEMLIDPATPPSKRVASIQLLIAQEKVKLLESTTNAEHAFFSDQVKQFLPKEKVTRFTSLESIKENFSITSWENSQEGHSFSIHLPDGEFSVQLPGVALTNSAQNNLLFGLTVLSILKKNMKTSLAKLPLNFKNDPGRSSLLAGVNNTLILDSSYNANPYAAKELFSVVKELAKKGKRKKVIVLGDFRELGEQTEELYNFVLKEASSVADILVLTNSLMKEYGIPLAEKHGFILNENLYWFKNGRQLAFHIQEIIEPNSVVLFEGSQDTVFLEYAVKELCENKDPLYIEKNLPRMTPDWLSMK